MSGQDVSAAADQHHQAESSGGTTQSEASSPTKLSSSPSSLDLLAQFLPPVTHSGHLLKKNDKLDAGKKATHRNWKDFYAELRGDWLVFYADAPDDDEETQAAHAAAAADSTSTDARTAAGEDAGNRKAATAKPNKDQLKKQKADEKKKAEREKTHKRAKSEVKAGDFDDLSTDKDLDQKLHEALGVGALSVQGAQIAVESDYVKEKRFVLRLRTKKVAEFLFEFTEEKVMMDWLFQIRGAAGERAPQVVAASSPASASSASTPKGKPGKLDVSSPASSSAAEKDSGSPTALQTPVVEKSDKADKADKATKAAEKKREKEEKERKEKEEKERKEKEEKERKEKEKQEKLERKATSKSQKEDDKKSGGLFGKSGKKDSKSGTLPKAQQKKQFFGIPISEQLISEDLAVPLLVFKCISKIDDSGLLSVGLYRLAGNNLTNQSLRNMFDSNPEKIDFNDTSIFDDDMNVIADCLKTYLRELPEPLIPYDLYDDFIGAGRMLDYDTRMLRIQELIHGLPEINFNTLQYLAGHLARVASNSEVNKMAASNLAIVFGPNVLKARVEDIQTMMHDMPYKCTVIEAMIQQPTWMFSPPENAPVEAQGPGDDFEYENLEQYNGEPAGHEQPEQVHEEGQSEYVYEEGQQPEEEGQQSEQVDEEGQHQESYQEGQHQESYQEGQQTEQAYEEGHDQQQQQQQQEEEHVSEEQQAVVVEGEGGPQSYQESEEQQPQDDSATAPAEEPITEEAVPPE